MLKLTMFYSGKNHIHIFKNDDRVFLKIYRVLEKFRNIEEPHWKITNTESPEVFPELYTFHTRRCSDGKTSNT